MLIVYKFYTYFVICSLKQIFFIVLYTILQYMEKRMREEFKSSCYSLQWIVGGREFFVFPPRQIPIRDRTLSRSWGLTGTHSHRKIAISNSAVTP